MYNLGQMEVLILWFIQKSGSNDLFLLEYPYTDNNHEHTDDRHIRVSVRQLRHIFKIHAVPASDEGQREKDGGNDSQILHIPVLTRIHLSLVDILDLACIVDQMDTTVQKTLRPVTDISKVFELFFRKQVVFIFFQLPA